MDLKAQKGGRQSTGTDLKNNVRNMEKVAMTKGNANQRGTQNKNVKI
jgi:hypothetical protein